MYRPKALEPWRSAFSKASTTSFFTIFLSSNQVSKVTRCFLSYGLGRSTRSSASTGSCGARVRVVAALLRVEFDQQAG